MISSWLLFLGAVVGLLAGCRSDAIDCTATATCPLPEDFDAGSPDGASTTGESDSGSSSTGELPLGASCSAPSDCESGFCVDGKCCETACDGPCERCDLAHASGQCVPVPEGDDPDGDCAQGDVATCHGVCDGRRGCRFPAHGTPCGAVSCEDGVQNGFVCNGEGSCVEAEVPCGDYACDAESCRSSCEDSSHCAESAYCDQNECRPRKENGGACSADEHCQSGICVDGVCCATACEAPASCSTGECLCNGVLCGTGESCTVFFLDGDGDGYPASSALDVVACSGSPPPDLWGHKYMDSSKVPLDCDDNDPDVHPGQTRFFTVPRADGSFDYDCDGIERKQYGSAAFRFCTVCWRPLNQCSVGLGLGSAPCDQIPAAFAGSVFAPECGKSGTLVRCRSTAACTSEKLTEVAIQGCR